MIKIKKTVALFTRAWKVDENKKITPVIVYDKV